MQLPRFDRLTVEADELGGRAIDRIQLDLPFIEQEDVQQALGYAAALARREVYVPLKEPA